MGLGEKDSVLSDNGEIRFDDENILSDDSIFDDKVISDDSILSNDTVFSDVSLISQEEREEVYRLIEAKKAEIEAKERELRKEQELKKALKDDFEKSEKIFETVESSSVFNDENDDDLPKKSMFEHEKSDGEPSYFSKTDKRVKKSYNSYYPPQSYYSRGEMLNKLLPIVGILLLCLVILLLPIRGGYVKAIVELIILVFWYNYKKIR